MVTVEPVKKNKFHEEYNKTPNSVMTVKFFEIKRKSKPTKSYHRRVEQTKTGTADECETSPTSKERFGENIRRFFLHKAKPLNQLDRPVQPKCPVRGFLIVFF